MGLGFGFRISGLGFGIWCFEGFGFWLNPNIRACVFGVRSLEFVVWVLGLGFGDSGVFGFGDLVGKFCGLGGFGFRFEV